MADTKISGLPASTTPLAGTEVLPIVQTGVTKQVSVANLTDGRAITAASAIISGQIIQGTSTGAVNGSLQLRRNITGGATAYVAGISATVQSDVTGQASGFSSFINTAAASFTLPLLKHYNAQQGTIGATSAVTNQYGFFADSSLVGATNNYGFYSDIASGTNRFNFAAIGTAANVFVGTTSIGGVVGSESLRATPVASAVNYVSVIGAVTTGAPVLSAAGSDTNIGITLTPKGTGVVTVSSDALINGITIGKGGGSQAQNNALGSNTLGRNTTGNQNTGAGLNSLFFNVTGSSNTGFGLSTLVSNTTANGQTAIGAGALSSATTNVATLGAITAGSGYTNGTYTAVTMSFVSGAAFNTYPTVTVVVSGGVVTTVTLVTAGVAATSTAATVLTVAAALIGGTGSGFSIPVATFATASTNTAVGVNAGSALTTGSNNLILGNTAAASTTTVSNEITLGNSSITAFRIPGLTITAGAKYMNFGSSTVALLAAAATAGLGARAFVTDALAPAFGVAVTGGGAVAVPVYSNGTTWLVG
jgi:hypothetical protein